VVKVAAAAAAAPAKADEGDVEAMTDEMLGKELEQLVAEFEEDPRPEHMISELKTLEKGGSRRARLATLCLEAAVFWGDKARGQVFSLLRGLVQESICSRAQLKEALLAGLSKAEELSKDEPESVPRMFEMTKKFELRGVLSMSDYPEAFAALTGGSSKKSATSSAPAPSPAPAAAGGSSSGGGYVPPSRRAGGSGSAGGSYVPPSRRGAGAAAAPASSGGGSYVPPGRRGGSYVPPGRR
jgi:hypothetical protein